MKVVLLNNLKHHLLDKLWYNMSNMKNKTPIRETGQWEG